MTFSVQLHMVHPRMVRWTKCKNVH